MPLPNGQIPQVQPRYPHMLPLDAAVWTRYLQEMDHHINLVWYDYHVGAQVTVPPDAPAWMHPLAAEISRKRIDVLALRGDTYTIIEVKPWGSMQALGQVMTYRELFIAEHPEIQQLDAAIVCLTADRDVLNVADQNGIEIHPLDGVLL